MRVVGDEDYTSAQMMMRRTDQARPVRSEYVEPIRKLTREDVEDPAWRFAPIAVLSLHELGMINEMQIERFARYFGLPLVRWRTVLAKPEELIRLDDDVDLFYDAEPGLWEYFVEGAPVLLMDNIKSTRGLVNGSPALQDSLDFGGNPIPDALRRAYEDGGYHLVTLDEPPAAVNVRVGSTKTDPHFWHGVQLKDLSGRLVKMDLLRDDESKAPQLVPLVRNATYKSTTAVKLRSELSANKAMPLEMRTKPFPYLLAFAITDYKLQSRTLPRLIVNLPQRRIPPYMKFDAWYVIFSRGTSYQSLRFLECDEEALEKLTALQHNEYYVAWNQGYNQTEAGGEFDQTRCEPARRAYNEVLKRAKAAAKTAARREAAREKRAANKKAEAAARKKTRARAARVSQEG